MLGVQGFLHKESAARDEGPDGMNFGELFTFVRSAGRRFLDRANEQLLQGPVADCLAPDPYGAPQAPRHAAMPVIGLIGSEVHEYAHMTDALARWIAAEGYNLLTFCAPGAAHAAARAFALSPVRTGRSLGVDEQAGDEVRRPAPEYVEVAVRVPPPCRACCARATGIFTATAHVVIVLPGASERHLEALGRAPTIVWSDTTGHGPAGSEIHVLKHAHHASKLAEVTRYVARILRAEMPAVADPVSDKEDESGDDYEIVDDRDSDF